MIQVTQSWPVTYNTFPLLKYESCLCSKDPKGREVLEFF